MKNHDNVFASIFESIRKMEEDHSDSPIKRDIDKFERKVSKKSFKPNHSRILMREKTKDEFDKVSKEVKYTSFIGLDEYGKSNSVVGRNGISKDAAVTRFNKKKVFKNLIDFIPTCGYEIELDSRGDITAPNIQNLLDFVSDYKDQEPEEYIEEGIPDDTQNLIKKKLNFIEVRDKKRHREISTNKDNSKFAKKIYEISKKYNNQAPLTEEELNLFYATIYDIDKLRSIDDTLWSHELAEVIRAMKSYYLDIKNDSLRTILLDDFFDVSINIIPIVRNHCSKMKLYQQRVISDTIRHLTTYSSHQDILDSYYSVIIYILTECISDMEDNVTLTDLFDSFTMLVAPQYQAMVMAKVAFLYYDDIDEIDPNILDTYSILLKEYIELLPTKVEALTMYLDLRFEEENSIDSCDYDDILDLVPISGKKESKYPATYKMLRDIAKKITQYASLF